jgi:hypothetical protein
MCQTAGFMGSEFDAVIPQGDLVEGPLTLRDLDAPPRVDEGRFARRRRLLSAASTKLSSLDPGRSNDSIYQKAFGLMDSAGVRQALDPGYPGRSSRRCARGRREPASRQGARNSRQPVLRR